jgi:hypothetical protein
MDIVPISNKKDTKKLIETGNKCIKNNRFFEFIDIIMNDTKMRDFVDDFFNDWDDIRTSIMFIKAYQVIDSQLSILENTSQLIITQDNRRKLMIGLIKELFGNGACRQELVYNLNEFMGLDNLKSCRKLITEKSNDPSMVINSETNVDLDLSE